MKPKRLYIIGNGFDLHHKINSSYKAFEAWLNQTGRLSGLDSVQSHFNCEDFWWSFEENLGKFDFNNFASEIARDNLPDMMSEHADRTRSDARCEVENILEDWRKNIWGSFPNWLAQLNDPDPATKVFINPSSALFISFNYTLTLETLYNIAPEQIIHIHGKLGDPPKKLLLGHGGLTVQYKDPFDGYTVDDPPDPNDQLAIEEAIRSAQKCADSWEKPIETNISNFAHIFDDLNKIEELYAYGFSFSEIDKPYIETINSHIPQGVIRIASWHTTNDIIKATRLLGEHTKFIRLNELPLIK